MRDSRSFFMSAPGMSSRTDARYLISSTWLHFFWPAAGASGDWLSSLEKVVSRSTVFLTPIAVKNLSLTDSPWIVGRSSYSLTEAKKDSPGFLMPIFVGTTVRCSKKDTTEALSFAPKESLFLGRTVRTCTANLDDFIMFSSSGRVGLLSRMNRSHGTSSSGSHASAPRCVCGTLAVKAKGSVVGGMGRVDGILVGTI